MSHPHDHHLSIFYPLPAPPTFTYKRTLHQDLAFTLLRRELLTHFEGGN